MVKVFYNIALLVVGFTVSTMMDYGYIKADAAHNPDSFFRKTQWMVWLFPVCVFGVNWCLFRSFSLAKRLPTCVALALVLFLVEIAILATVGMEIHFRMGGTL